MMKTSIIGLGPMGRRHIQVVKELGLEISGLCDKSQTAIEKTKAEFGFSDELFFDNAEKMLKKNHSELVVIATNSDSHYLFTKLAVETGARYVFCEKPMANSIADAKGMIEICEKNDVFLGINHQQRYMDCYKNLKKVIKSEKLGGLETFSITAANIGIVMNGSHYIDLGIILFEEDFVKVWGKLKESPVPNPRGEKFKDPGGILIAETESGKNFILSVGIDEGFGVNMVFSCKLGYIFYNPLSGETIMNYRKEEYRELPTTRYGMPNEREILNLPQDDIILSSKTVLEDLLKKSNDSKKLTYDSSKIIKILAGAYKSSQEKCRCIDINNDEINEEIKYSWP